MTRHQDLTFGGLVVMFLLAAGYCVTLLLAASFWFDHLLRQPSWVVVAAIVVALYLPIQLARSVQWRNRDARHVDVESRARFHGGTIRP